MEEKNVRVSLARIAGVAGATALGAAGVACFSGSSGSSVMICGEGTAAEGGECVAIALAIDAGLFCGPGTTLSGQLCVPTFDAAAGAIDAAAYCGPGTALVAGLCVPMQDATVGAVDAAAYCGPGTTWSAGVCVPVLEASVAFDAAKFCGAGTTLSGGLCVPVPTEAGPVEAAADAPAFTIDAPVEQADGGPPFFVVSPARVLNAAYEGALADFDGDGNLDLAVAGEDLSATSGAVVALGDGYGSFVYETTVTGVGSLESIATGDFTRSGHQDLVMISSAGPYVARGNGDGTFGAAMNLNPQNTMFSGGNAVATGDFNGDGWLDVAAGTDSGMFLFFNDRAGGFTGPVLASSTTVFNRFGVGDLNGDGVDDMAWGTNDLEIALSNVGDAGTFTVTELPNNASNTRWVALGHLVNGGPLDIVATNTDSDPLYVEVQRANGTYVPEVAYGSNLANEPVVTGDFDGDGNVDVASSESNPGSVLFFHGNGDGTVAAPAIYPLSGSPAFVLAGDVTKDHKLDVVAITSSGYVVTLAE